MQQVQGMIAPESSQFVSAASLRVRLDWFNQLRWGVVVGLLVVILAARFWLGVELSLVPMLMVCGVLAVLNAAYALRNRRVEPVSIKAELRLVKLQMLCDLLALTVLLSLSGGIENPFYFVYVIHVILASLLLKGPEIFKIALLAIVLFTSAVIGEYLGWLPSHPLLHAGLMPHDLPYVLVTLASFSMVLLFAAFIGASIMKHNRAIKDELVERQAALVAADRAKMDFFRFVTHEVKSPVTTARSAVETALELGAMRRPEQVEDLLCRAVGRLEQATQIVKDLSNLTRGHLRKRDELREIDLTRLVGDVVEAQRDLANQRGQQLAVHLPAGPVVVTTSGFMVEKIVNNLVGNAVSYNRDGGPIDVTLRLDGQNILLDIRDEGIGIEEQDRQRIFEEFYRAPNAQAICNLGTGLGLPIVKKFATELGGDIKVVSEVEAGSTFTLVLPRRGAAAATWRNDG